jgi:hypothetical protein
MVLIMKMQCMLLHQDKNEYFIDSTITHENEKPTNNNIVYYYCFRIYYIMEHQIILRFQC